MVKDTRKLIILYPTLVLCSVGLFATLFINTTKSALAASPGDIVINEIHYNPQSDIDGDEFIELYNTTPNPIDISNWCFTDGVSLCFNSGIIINAHTYTVVSNNSAQTLLTYGITTIGTYSGKLSNGGEQLTLADSTTQTIDSVSYDDDAPWAISPDGGGPSLERKDPTNNGSLYSSWGASTTNKGTPGQANSLLSLQTPELSNLSMPISPSPATSPSITVQATDAGSVNLFYTVMFNAEQSINMVDDGANGDQVANDGIYTGIIPAQSAGTLVRYKVVATNVHGSTMLPASSDTMPHKGYVVNDSQTATIPIIRWYIDPLIFDDLVTNHATDDFYVPTVVAVGDQIFDGTKVRIKGQSSTSYAKKKFKFDLPKGYTLGQPYFAIPVNEFAINTYFLNLSDLTERLTWQAMSQYGFDDLLGQYVRVQKNTTTESSEFYGHYLMIEGYDKSWRERTNHQDGAMYKEFNDKKTRKNENNADILSLENNLKTLHNEELKNYLLDNIDIPNLINYDALSTVLISQDWSFYKNIYQYQDTDGTQRWKVLPWDLDNAMVVPIFEGDGPNPINLNPLTNGPDYYNDDRLLEQALYQFPEFREMYNRRVATLYDKLVKQGKLKAWYQELYSLSSSTIQEDLSKWASKKSSLINQIFPSGLPWGFPADFPYAVTPESALSGIVTAEQQNEIYLYGLNRYENIMDGKRSAGEFPLSQPSNPSIIINEINYQPSNGSDSEYVELYNPNDFAVDVSGWRITGTIDITLPQGSVIAAKGYGLLVNNDTVFRSTYPGSQYIIGEYNNNLGNDQTNQLILLRADGTTAFNLPYGINTPWPNSSFAGYSLALMLGNSNWSNPYCWSPSSTIGGTPGEPNTINSIWNSSYGSACYGSSTSTNPNNRQLSNTGTPLIWALIVGVVLLSSSLFFCIIPVKIKRYL